ncbi:putative gnat family protein [Phaeoacremonium minimum UCRPA7]|uniref:Putative gnat family protein n=1 Tax=Phaeoacremonium minimum (strain UCR-PA7) TaxID=1286976 RepID=R8BG66_PHAM7|nr:putative gnat family protein [Phaeoacremonium minimum UCRPA7]EON98284.1 putative gnat family protein [Phaeoacremonium minimum UCRPA7]
MTSCFNVPINLSRLENDRLKLVPLKDNLEEWGAAWVEDGIRNSKTYDWLTYGPFASGAEYVLWYNDNCRNDTSTLLLAILLKAGTVTRRDPVTGETASAEIADGTFAGLCGIVSQPERATMDMGQLLVSSFQRTFEDWG